MGAKQPKSLTQLKSSRQSIISKTLLLWTHSFSSLYHRLSHNVLREVCSYLGDFGHILALTETTISEFDLSSCTWGQPIRLSEQIGWDCYSRYVLVDHMRLCCCGKGRAHTEPPQELYSRKKSCFGHQAKRAYLLELVHDLVAVTKLPRMKEFRSSPGLVYHNGIVYAFGGTVYAGRNLSRSVAKW